MKKSDVLKQERTAKVDAQNTVIQLAKAENRDFTADEAAAFDTRDAEIAALDAKIDRAIKAEKIELDVASRTAAIVTPAVVDGDKKEKDQIRKRASITSAIRSVMKGQPLEGAEKEMHELGLEENRAAGVTTPDNSQLQIPMSMLRATGQTVTQDSGEYGGQLVQDNAPRVQTNFSPANILERLGATRLTGLSGGDIPLPVTQDYDFAWLAEEEAITLQKKKFDGPKLSPNRLGAGVDINNRLLMQSSVNVEQIIRQQLANGYDRAINAAAINGPGTGNAPTGILNTAGIGLSSIAAGAAPTRKDITELISLVMSADSTSENLSFLMTHLLHGDLMSRLADAGSGRYLMNENNVLNGYNAVASNHVPQLGGLETLIFGDFSQLFIGEWGSMSVVTDGYTGASTNSVRLWVNGHADVAIAQPKAFAAHKFNQIS